MRTPGFLEGVAVALAASVATSILFGAMAPLFGGDSSRAAGNIVNAVATADDQLVLLVTATLLWVGESVARDLSAEAGCVAEAAMEVVRPL